MDDQSLNVLNSSVDPELCECQSVLNSSVDPELCGRSQETALNQSQAPELPLRLQLTSTSRPGSASRLTLCRLQFGLEELTSVPSASSGEECGQSQASASVVQERSAVRARLTLQ